MCAFRMQIVQIPTRAIHTIIIIVVVVASETAK